MFNSEKKTESKIKYDVTVDNVRKTKNDSILMVDLTVNGVRIYSAIFKEVTVKKDGKKYKAGDKCYMLSMPSEKVGDKYFDRVWFPVSNETLEDVTKQIQNKLEE